LQWRLERQQEIKRQDLVIVIKPVARRGIGQLRLFAVGRGKGEVAEFLQRLDVDLGKRLEFFTCEFALLFAFQPLRRKSRKHVIEGQGVADPRDAAVRRINQLRLHRHPDVGVRLRKTAGGQKEQ